jgi:hypothetical protein
MGRQIGIYALPEDLQAFLDFARGRDPVEVTLREADRPELEVISSPSTETRIMTLWHRALTPDLRRELVTLENGTDYYKVPISLPVLEINPSRIVEWNGQPGLLAGRLYGFHFDPANEAYARWYDALARWIRSHFVKNPVSERLGGYVGKAALEWFRQGGMLLPMFLPPKDPDWMSFLGDQDKARAALTPPDSDS